MNIQQTTTSEVENTDKVMAYNEDLYPPMQHDISNVFSAADLLYQSSSDSDRYKRAYNKARVIRLSILYSA